MIKRLLCAVLLTCAYASAQTINPNQIRPSTTDGQALCTEGGVTTWGACGGGGGGTITPSPQFQLGYFTNEGTADQIGGTPATTDTSGDLTSPGSILGNLIGNQYFASRFGTGSNGVETVYGNSSYCLPQASNTIPWGCNIQVSPYYTNSDVPQGWAFGGAATGNFVNDTLLPSGGSAFDYRNGTLAMYFQNPINPVTGQSGGLVLRNDGNYDLGMRDMLGRGGAGAPTGIMNYLGAEAGGWDFLYYPYMTQYVNQDYRYGFNNVMDNWTSGISFLYYDTLNCHGKGDCMLYSSTVKADGGILAGSSEGVKISDWAAKEDTVVFTGTISGSPAQGATSILVACTIGCGTQGQGRLIEDNASADTVSGTHFTNAIGPAKTGTTGESAAMPPYVTDSTQSFPVSTIVQLCNAGANNGEGGAAGCTAGSQPSGVIPPVPLRVSITSGSVSSGVGTFVGSNSLVVGQVVILFNFTGSGSALNGLSATVQSAGLSSSGFTVTVSAANITSTGAGNSTQSPTGFSPPESITLNVVAPYTGTGGDTNGLPSGFCSSSNLQSSNSGGSCYMPASGTGCLTDSVEYETVNYTYNSTAQTVTIPSMRFPHLNGVMFATGGLCNHAVEDLSSEYTGGGTSGTIDEVYPIAASLNSTTFYYITQRTNEGYGSPMLGGSTDGGSGNGNNSGGGGTLTALCFSTSSSNYSLSGLTVTFSMNEPAGTSNTFALYNGLPLTINTPNSAYNGTFTATYVGGSTFTYTLPSAPSGSTPTSGTIGYCNANYNVKPAARVLSVFNTANNKVDGTMILMPNDVAFGSGDAVSEPHFQKMLVTGTHSYVTQLQPEEYISGNTYEFNFAGTITGPGEGVGITNEASSNIYLGHGGTTALPYQALQFGGTWEHVIYVNSSPDNAFAYFLNCKEDIGCSSPSSNFNLFVMPELPNAAPGVNDEDALNYDPNFRRSTRSQGLISGRWYFDNSPYGGTAENGALSYGWVEGGYFEADQQMITPALTASNVNTSQLTNTPGNAPSVVGTPGSTNYDYWIVGHGISGGTTIPYHMGGMPHSLTNGNATLSSSNRNLLCAFQNPGFASYDFYKTDTNTLLASGVTPGNGATYGQQSSYACVTDIGQSTTSQTAPSTNTTGGGNFQGPLTMYTATITSLIGDDGCLESVSGVVISTGTACGSGGGGGLPTATAPGQFIASSAAGTTYAPQGQIFYAQSGDTIASIESECSSLCTYVVTTPQTFTLAANHTLSASVNPYFMAGGEWTVNGSGFTLTISAQVSGALTQHFAGSGKVSLGSNNSLVPVEWFGATGNGSTDDASAINATITAMTAGQIQLQCGATYLTTSATISITKPGVGIQGCADSRGALVPVITTASASNDIVDLHGPSAGSPIVGGVFRNFQLWRSVIPTGTAAGFSCQYSWGNTIDTVNSWDSVRDFYIHQCSAIGVGQFSNSNADFTLSGYTSGMTLYGWYLDSTDGNAENSLRLRNYATSNDTGTFAATFNGVALIGTSINDVMSYGLETGNATNGVVIDYTGSGPNLATSDIHFTNSIIDGTRNSCFLIENTSAATAGSVSIMGGECNGYNSTGKLVDIESSYGVTITNLQIFQHDVFTSADGIYANGSTGLVLANNTLTNVTGVPIFLNGTTNSSVTGNNIYNSSAESVTNAIELASSSVRNTLTANTIPGYATNGISLQSSSGNNQGFTTNTFSGNVTTQVSDTSSAGTNQVGPTLATLAITGTSPAVPNAAAVAYGSNFFELEGFGANTTTWPDLYIATRNSDQSVNSFYLHCTYNSGSPICTFPGNVTTPTLTVSGLTGHDGCLQGASGVVSSTGAPCGSGAEVVTFSATPTFSLSTNVSRIVLTGNITSFTLGAGVDGQNKKLCFKQGSAYTVTPPTNVHGGFWTALTTATSGTWSCQSFNYDLTDAIWLADSPGVVGQ